LESGNTIEVIKGHPRHKYEQRKTIALTIIIRILVALLPPQLVQTFHL